MSLVKCLLCTQEANEGETLCQVCMVDEDCILDCLRSKVNFIIKIGKHRYRATYPRLSKVRLTPNTMIAYISPFTGMLLMGKVRSVKGNTIRVCRMHRRGKPVGHSVDYDNIQINEIVGIMALWKKE